MRTDRNGQRKDQLGRFGSLRRVEPFWFAQKCMHRLATRGLPPGTITETIILAWLREIRMVLGFWEIGFLLHVELGVFFG